MNIRIGLADSPQVIEIEVNADTDLKSLRKNVEASIEGKNKFLWIQDKRNNEICIAAQKIAFVEIGSEDADRHIGFGV